jgi:hypothetical protein
MSGAFPRQRPTRLLPELKREAALSTAGIPHRCTQSLVDPGRVVAALALALARCVLRISVELAESL